MINDLLYRHLTRTIYESTEDLEEGYTWDKIKGVVRKKFDPLYDFKHKWIGTWYKDNIVEANNHLKKCIKHNADFNDLLNFETSSYTMSGRINELYVLADKSLIESVLLKEDEDDEELAALEKELADKEAKIKALKTKINMRGADEDNYQKAETDYDAADQDDEDTSDYKISAYITPEQLKEPGNGEWIKVEPTKADLYEKFPILKKNFKVYNNILALVAKEINKMLKYGLKTEPSKGHVDMNFEPDGLNNKSFKFKLHIEYEAKDQEWAQSRRISDKEDEGVLPLIAAEMEKHPDKNEGNLTAYDKTWKFDLEVLNADKIIEFEKANTTADSEVIQKNIGTLELRYSDYLDEVAEKFEKYASTKIVNDKKSVNQTSAAIKQALDDVITSFKNFTDISSNTPEEIIGKIKNEAKVDVPSKEERETTPWMVKAIKSLSDKYAKAFSAKISKDGSDAKISGFESNIESAKNLINSLCDRTINYLAKILSLKERYLDAKSQGSVNKVESEEDIHARARKAIVKWLGQNRADVNDIKEDPGNGRIYYSKDLLCGRRDSPLAIETHFDIVLEGRSDATLSD